MIPDRAIERLMLDVGYVPGERVRGETLRAYSAALLAQAVAACEAIRDRYPPVLQDDLSRARRTTADNCARAIAEAFRP